MIATALVAAALAIGPAVLSRLGASAAAGALNDPPPSAPDAGMTVVGDAQQPPGVVGQEAPVRDANKLP
jgi:hypothetical protein